MESSVGATEHIDDNQRNVRPRLSGSIHAEPKGEQQQRSSSPKLERAVGKMSSPLGKVVAGNPFFIVTEEGVWSAVMGGMESSPLFDEAERCWREHRATGKMHHEPPWRLCSAVEDNREHPYYLRWLDTMKLPPLEELLQEDGSNAVVTGSSAGNHCGATMKEGIVDSECVSKVQEQQQKQQQHLPLP